MKKKLVKKCQKIAEHYGLNTQEFQAVSEIFELGQVLTRRPGQRTNGWKGELLDEMADVTITIQQLRLLYDISDETFEEKVIEKLDIQLDRIKSEGGSQSGKEDHKETGKEDNDN